LECAHLVPSGQPYVEHFLTASREVDDFGVASGKMMRHVVRRARDVLVLSAISLSVTPVERARLAVERDAPSSSSQLPHIAVIAEQSGWQLVLRRPARGRYEDITFVDSRRGWVVASSGEVLHTSDGGDTWLVQAKGLGPLRSVEFLDADHGLAGTLSGNLFATQDGGVTWRDITQTLPRKPVGFCGMAWRGTTVHLVGRYIGAADYFASDDAGKTWRAKDLRDQAMGLVDVVFVNDSVGLIAGMSRPTAPAAYGNALIQRTSDGGESWAPVFRGDISASWAWKLFPLSQSVVYASLQSPDGTHRVAKTIDGGTTWRTMIVARRQPPGQPLQTVGFLDEKMGWAGGFFGGLYATADSGRTWSQLHVTGGVFNRFAKAGDALITAGSEGILRYEPSSRRASVAP
jgi:photosystem II stability/assembly factor-like uncharacterized protein